MIELVDKLKITYRVGNEIYNGIDERFLEVVIIEKAPLYKVILKPKVDIELVNCMLEMYYVFKHDDRIFLNGYQSWTDSFERTIYDKMPRISMLAAPVMKKYHFDKYGDYGIVRTSKGSGEMHGFTYGYIRRHDTFDLIGSLSERQGFTIIKTVTKEHKITIEKDIKGVVISEDYPLYQLILTSGREQDVFDNYFDAMAIEKPKVKPMKGWTSWYHYYQNISEEIILDNLNAFDDYEDIDMFQIDDGYQTYVGDWLDIDKKKFPNGMKTVAGSIHDKGYKAGLWLAPFVCEKHSRIYREHPEWLLRDEKGEEVVCGSNWSGFVALDLENEAVRDYLKEVFHKVLNEWGYDMVKLDFLYAAAMLNRKYKSRGQLMCEAMDFLRAIIGGKLILGCGVPLGPAFGKVDFCRIGCDVGLDWDDKFYMRRMHRERISTKHAIKNAIGRRHLDGRAFMNDPDVFLLRDNIILTPSQRYTLGMVNGLFGSLLFTSDYVKEYNTEQWHRFKGVMNRCFEKVKDVKIIDREALIVTDHHSINYLINLSNKERMYHGVLSAPYSIERLGE